MTKITRKQLKDCFDHAIAMMPMKGETAGANVEQHPADEAFRKTMLEVFVLPFKDAAPEAQPMRILKDHFWGLQPCTHRNTHLGSLGAYIAVNADSGGLTKREAAEIRSKFADVAAFEKFFRGWFEGNKIKVKALDLG